MEPRIIFHVDVNSAYLSWEAVERLKNGDPEDLRLISSAVGGDVTTRHGIITAKSIPAKAFGIRTGEPVVSALRKCPDLKLIPSNFALYERCSEAFIAICREMAPVEQFSIDECFLDMTGIVPGNERREAVKMADTLRARIRDELGFTVNVGVGNNKLLAKMASDFTKPDRTHTLFTDEIPKKMWPLPAIDLLYLGKSGEARLRNLGVRTIGDIALLPLSVLKAHMGEKSGIMLYESARGIDETPVRVTAEDEKSYGHSITLSADLTDLEDVKPVLLHLSDKVCRRMRRDGVRAGLVAVHYKSNEFKTLQRQHKLPYVTHASDLIYREALSLFTELWDQTTPIRLVGLSLGALSRSEEQLNFLIDEEREKREKLDAMLDTIRDQYGRDAVVRMREVKKERGRKKDDRGTP